MAGIRVKKLNEVYLRVESVQAVEEELAEHFSFEKLNHRFKKAKGKDSTYHLYYRDGRRLYVGLLSRLEEFAKEHRHILQKDEESFKTELERDLGITEPFTEEIPGFYDDATGEYRKPQTITIEDPEKDSPVDEEEFRAWAGGLEIRYEPAAWIGDFEMNSPPRKIRDYQTKAMLDILNLQRGIVLFPHNKDKFPAMCCLLRWLLKRNKQILFVLSGKGIVDRMHKELGETFPNECEAGEFYMSDHLQRIYANLPKEVSKPIVLANGQSIHKQPKEWFEQFDVVMMDEVDGFNPEPLIDIMKKTVNAKHRIGFVDTLEDAKTHEMILEGLFGSSVVCENPEVAKKKRPDLDVTFFRLNYPDKTREAMKGSKRADEIKFIQQDPKRNEFICEKACELEGNTLVLFEKTEQGEALRDIMRERLARYGMERKVFFSAGPMGENDEEDMRVNVGKNDGCIIVASYRRIDADFRIPSLDNIVFASPYKKEIRKLRDVGRGLKPRRKHCNLYDIADNLHIGDWENPTMTEARARLKGYKTENLTVKIEDVGIGES